MRTWLPTHLAAVRILIVLTLIVGLAYPLGMTAIAQLPGLRDQANGSLVEVGGKPIGSILIGQSFMDDQGRPIAEYFQGRPSDAGAGDDPTASGASNLGPASIVDTPPNPADPHASGELSLLSQICRRSKRIGAEDGVDGRRPYCTSSGVGAVLGVFHANGLTGPVARVVSLNQPCPQRPFRTTYEGVPVECARYGGDYSKAVPTPIRGDAPASPAVPSDAVTTSGSGLDPDISPAYARVQAPRVARARGISTAAVLRLIRDNTTHRALDVLGEPVVNVLELNLALDRLYPKQGA